MTTELHNPAELHGPEGRESVEMPRPTAAPLVLSLGVAFLREAMDTTLENIEKLLANT